MVSVGRLLNLCLVIAALIGGALFQVASASDTSYLGTWKITSAVVAPWWDDAVHKPDAIEMRTLVGKTVTITPTAIQGPRAIACKGTRYVVKDYPADMLFEGAFGEMHARDKSVDPGKIAERVGFRGSHWKTLETGCAVEVNYHFIDPATIAFGLNNYIYTMKKQQ